MKKLKITSIVLSLISFILPFINGAFIITKPFNAGTIVGVSKRTLAFFDCHIVASLDIGTINFETIALYGIAFIFMLIGLITAIQKDNTALLFASQSILLIYMFVCFKMYSGEMEYLGYTAGMKKFTFIGWLFIIIVLIALVITLIYTISTNNKHKTYKELKIDVAEELIKYKKLLDENIITKEEFENKKKELLNLK